MIFNPNDCLLKFLQEVHVSKTRPKWYSFKKANFQNILALMANFSKFFSLWKCLHQWEIYIITCVPKNKKYLYHFKRALFTLSSLNLWTFTPHLTHCALLDYLANHVLHSVSLPCYHNYLCFNLFTTLTLWKLRQVLSPLPLSLWNSRQVLSHYNSEASYGYIKPSCLVKHALLFYSIVMVYVTKKITCYHLNKEIHPN